MIGLDVTTTALKIFLCRNVTNVIQSLITQTSDNKTLCYISISTFGNLDPGVLYGRIIHVVLSKKRQLTDSHRCMYTVQDPHLFPSMLSLSWPGNSNIRLLKKGYHYHRQKVAGMGGVIWSNASHAIWSKRHERARYMHNDIGLPIMCVHHPPYMRKAAPYLTIIHASIPWFLQWISCFVMWIWVITCCCFSLLVIFVNAAWFIFSIEIPTRDQQEPLQQKQLSPITQRKPFISNTHDLDSYRIKQSDGWFYNQT